MKLLENHKHIYEKYMNTIKKINFDIKMIKIMSKFALKKELPCEQEVLAIEGNMTDSSKPNKKRSYTFYNGDVYVGKMINGKMNGKGVYMFSEGNWAGQEYVGTFMEDIKSGKGMCTFPNGSVYVGEWENDNIHGIGKMTYQSKDEYIGEWEEGKKQGMGIYKWDEGSVYVGQFKNSKMEGKGTCYDRLGKIIYKGDWKNNLSHGKGVYVWDEHRKYIGEFLYGKKHGTGTFYIDGEVAYKGEWRFDKPYIFDKTIDELKSAYISE